MARKRHVYLAPQIRDAVKNSQIGTPENLNPSLSQRQAASQQAMAERQAARQQAMAERQATAREFAARVRGGGPQAPRLFGRAPEFNPPPQQPTQQGPQSFSRPQGFQQPTPQPLPQVPRSMFGLPDGRQGFNAPQDPGFLGRIGIPEYLYMVPDSFLAKGGAVKKKKPAAKKAAVKRAPAKAKASTAAKTRSPGAKAKPPTKRAVTPAKRVKR